MTGPLVFCAPRGAKLKLDQGVVERLASYRQTGPKDREAGGILLGRHLLASPHRVVDDVTEPMAGDRRTRCQFKRGQAGHQKRADAAWEASGGTCVYLGEWHTHPEPIPNPSSTDLDDWRRRLREDLFAGDTLHFIIVGIHEIRAWEGHREGLILSMIDAE